MSIVTNLALPGRAPPLLRRNGSVGPATGPLRFTLDGDDALERRLAATCRDILAGVRGLVPAPRLEAILLGGGYGRGEGGVRRTDAGDQPYNDLEFYVCLRGNRHLNEWRHHRALEVLGRILSPSAGVDVEFKIVSLAALRTTAVTMFSYDLIMGHRWLLGHGGSLYGFTRHRDASQFAPLETTRLLMNRCSGLLLARERLEHMEFTSADADFVHRNLAKAELAFGDAVLAVHGLYHWSAPERHRRLMEAGTLPQLPWLDAIRAGHATGLAFKLHPFRSTATRAEFLPHFARVTALGLQVFLWHEERRLGYRFDTPQHYVADPRDMCPETDPWRDFAVNFKLSGPRACLTRASWRHPRDAILRELVTLLWMVDEAAAPASTAPFAARVAAYAEQWRRVQ